MATNLAVFLILSNIPGIEANYYDLALIISSNLVDLDHLFSRPIYHPKRNPFKTHFLHKKWMYMIALSFILFFVRPVMFLGVGLLLHFLLDYIYIKREKV
ncbi:MAG: hypothetical protein A2830_03965 [Candidatus Taylorbacteria bacterium RIFCSPHIGHO2_01_FULL_44_110]|uniref:Metal-dependent hydrolase n=1 Tax=Candidatus Taylorbacteria bacterium RIFCSPHIGHO2_12_FULL_45_16 TaxID=1802315 RepID=A0A1G2MYD6_9BACT|nr:MAG: hypothetical protein A2830_03965 [Candidatus Taylorbacteria bacterium RIFCSPHIGHO2_01_FULL_44_110]OHA28848.1 MAG: hypothetical protein A3F51_02245 [Candidatus Taylorbacteria bacterium RIFCSPHIGHO2_12_FULL_45_16]OHA32903.1 MAG: hypothetical protein A3A23_03045 [Candidatus Taylorbacteria bacterium RIFCSPLOWO2_01_FULL_45_59]OHA38309.1 MAG: hypothetical protein A3I98_02835 [Candidatus Taylorbacteria bacterium RIFCSPLOWO2_02_FULL_45_10b]OHA43961.1 MAG: hypothetical protein A3G04_00970 [Candi